MIIDLKEVKERTEPLRIETQFIEGDLQLPSDVGLNEPVAFQSLIEAIEERIRVRGSLRAEVELTCSRCATGFDEAISRKFDLFYEKEAGEVVEGEEVGLNYGDLEIGFYANEELDLSVIATEQIVLEIPMKPICQPECKGLCDQCGKDLNGGPCGCQRDEFDPRLAPLQALKKRMME